MWQSAAAGIFNLFSNAPPLYQCKKKEKKKIEKIIMTHQNGKNENPKIEYNLNNSF